MNTPSPRYQEVARAFRAYATAERMNLVARPATAAEIAEAEQSLGAVFPDSFRWFQLEFGDFQRGPIDIYSVRTPVPPAINIVGINREARTEEGPRLPAHLIAFSDSGGGDYLCFDTRRREANECPVVWWDHEQDEDQEPQAAAPSFLDWLESDLKEQAAEDRPSLLDSLVERSIAGLIRGLGKDRPPAG